MRAQPEYEEARTTPSDHLPEAQHDLHASDPGDDGALTIAPDGAPYQLAAVGQRHGEGARTAVSGRLSASNRRDAGRDCQRD